MNMFLFKEDWNLKMSYSAEDCLVKSFCSGHSDNLFCFCQTLSVSMLLRYSHHQIFTFMGGWHFFEAATICSFCVVAGIDYFCWFLFTLYYRRCSVEALPGERTWRWSARLASLDWHSHFIRSEWGGVEYYYCILIAFIINLQFQLNCTFFDISIYCEFCCINFEPYRLKNIYFKNILIIHYWKTS